MMKCQKCKKYIESATVSRDGKLLCDECAEAESKQKKKRRKKKK